MDKGSRRDDAPFDVQEGTFQFGVRIVCIADKLPRSIAAAEITRQLIRAGTSVGANMEEASEGLSRRDFLNHVRIARKEAKESRYWLAVIRAADLCRDSEVTALREEAGAIVRILTSIIKKSSP